MPNDKQQRARRRARNSQAPDLFRRAVETDATLRKSTASEAPSSRRGASAIGPPSSRRGASAAKRPAGSVKSGNSSDALDFEAPPEAEPKSGKVSERRPKSTPAPPSSVDSAAGRAAVLPGSEIEAPRAATSPSPSSRAPLIGAVIALLGVGVVLLIWRLASSPADQAVPTATSGETSAAPTQVAEVPPIAAPEPPALDPAPTASAAAQETSGETPSKDGKKKKKKKATAPTAKPAATSAPTTTPAPAPAFQFQFN